jgi:macrolide transport system ATP-binding/permease protein
MKLSLSICLSLYRRLASAYPHEFRMVYGEDLDRMGEDAVPEVWRRYGLLGFVRLLGDIALRLPVEYLAEIRQDVVYALRGFARAPGFTAVGVISLAVGIGMCSVILCGSNAMLGPLPGAREPGALATARRPVSYPYFERYRDQRQVPLAAAAFLGPVPFAVASASGGNARAQRFFGHLVSPEYFSTVGVTPAQGRFFRAETEKPGAAPVVVVSERFWRGYLNSDPRAVGSAVRLNGQPATIVGVAPKGFLGMWPWNPADLFVPVTCGAAVAPELSGDPLHRAELETFRLVLRLPRGLNLAAASAGLDAETLALDRQYPNPERDRDPKARRLRLIPAGTLMFVTPENRAFVVSFNVLLWGMVVSLVCANLANLLLARGAQRRREIAVRLSVGASRARLVRQLLVESILLSLAGGAAGIAATYWITRILSSLPMPSQSPIRTDFQPNFAVLAITLGISAAAGVGFGLVPALASMRTDMIAALKEGALAPLRGYRRFGLRNLFMGYQVAASVMLLLVTGYMVTGYRNVTRLDPGFDTAGLNLLYIDPVRDGYSGERLQALLSKLPQEMSRANGVHSAALAAEAPFASLSAAQPNTRVSAPGADANAMPVWTSVFSERVGASFFATLGAPLVRGREFDRRDEESEPPPGTAAPAIINQSAARALFGAQDPIGRSIREGGAAYAVVGVTRDVRSGFMPPKPVATVFLPLTAAWMIRIHAPRATLLVRGEDGRATLTAARDELARLHPDLTVFSAQTMRENLAGMNSFVEWSSSIYLVLGLFALLLACVGLGGVTAYAVARRRREIGIRMALGARTGQVRGLVLREGAALVAAGSLLGILGATAIARAASSVTAQLANVFQTRIDDPLLVGGAPLLLAALGLFACYLPARRATRIDPAAALREE